MSLFKRLKRVVPILWKDKATITGTEPVKHGAVTNNEPATIVEDEPCKVILKGQSTSVQNFYGTDKYDAKLLIRNGISIPAGAVIYITDQNGNSVKYKNASKSYSGYYSHQELAMERMEKA
ncbi:hypothetical protein GCM10022297_01150 [Lactobacillus hamsteri]|uniref:Uncharacterized protein n=1 Tax=Lactobacillus hamsteri DSM 5661 = JCM 6256 TaxID=1423754 RepID=A0A0R1Y4X5_9LACO|nr:hypothetical protein [Lactobacillus hamsteri]KRM37005.1 hypothetical protein FC39_GL000457 [Lactobacillus hamsteri DSM 5661 = JCM 6256]